MDKITKKHLKQLGRIEYNRQDYKELDDVFDKEISEVIDGDDIEEEQADSLISVLNKQRDLYRAVMNAGMVIPDITWKGVRDDA